MQWPPGQCYRQQLLGSVHTWHISSIKGQLWQVRYLKNKGFQELQRCILRLGRLVDTEYLGHLKAGNDSCQPVFGDTLDRAVSWKNGASVGNLKDQPVRLRFEPKDADLYALRFA